MNRWTLQTLDGLETYVFTINPNAQESPYRVRSITWDFHPTVGFSGRRAPRLPQRWSFSGVLRTREQYDALILWANKGVKVRLTDDRGDKFVVRLTNFSPTQQGGARVRVAPFRFTYTMEAFVYEIQEAP